MSFGQFNVDINPGSFRVEQNYKLDEYQHAILVKKKTDQNVARALRLRVGRVGYSAFLNELNVYLLPNFKHSNILPFLGHDKRHLEESDEMFTSLNTLQDDDRDETYHSRSSSDSGHSEAETDTEPKKKREPKKYKLPTYEVPIEYWIVNDFSGCITLRHYIMMHTLNWTQMVNIAYGIARGLLYLHENECELGGENLRKVEKAWAESTDGNVQNIYFRPATRGWLRVSPPHRLTIIHRSLSSLNIVLRSDLTPCIWNFGTARVYHPMQPINFTDYIDKPTDQLHANSVYSPPEVLMKNSQFTLQAMKAIDMYSVGIILWELMARCELPPIDGENNHVNGHRREPYPYKEPLTRELVTESIQRYLLVKNVVERQIRPRLRHCWMRGHKSARFVRSIRELWDQNYDARIQARTLFERLSILSRNSSSDKAVRNYWFPYERTPLTEKELQKRATEAEAQSKKSGLDLNFFPDIFMQSGPEEPSPESSPITPRSSDGIARFRREFLYDTQPPRALRDQELQRQQNLPEEAGPSSSAAAGDPQTAEVREREYREQSRVPANLVPPQHFNLSGDD